MFQFIAQLITVFVYLVAICAVGALVLAIIGWIMHGIDELWNSITAPIRRTIERGKERHEREARKGK